jgi:SAM-dependent methyltransferase
VKPVTDFDRHANSYDRELGEALALSGEDREYFARGRSKQLAERLRRLDVAPHHLMDFGCGTGSTTPILLEIFGAESAIGLDPSLRSLDVAKQTYGSEQIHFFPVHEYRPAGDLDLAYCNGVFHHIPPADRGAALRLVRESLRPGGLFSFWENNPWNPGTRYVMAHCAFDEDAQTISPPKARAMLRAAGFKILQTDFAFVFPKFLGILRPLEKLLCHLPIGAQYHVLCRKPLADL